MRKNPGLAHLQVELASYQLVVTSVPRDRGHQLLIGEGAGPGVLTLWLRFRYVSMTISSLLTRGPAPNCSSPGRTRTFCLEKSNQRTHYHEEEPRASLTFKLSSRPIS